jgi:hypothetical protein
MEKREKEKKKYIFKHFFFFFFGLKVLPGYDLQHLLNSFTIEEDLYTIAF